MSIITLAGWREREEEEAGRHRARGRLRKVLAGTWNSQDEAEARRSPGSLRGVWCQAAQVFPGRCEAMREAQDGKVGDTFVRVTSIDNLFSSIPNCLPSMS